MARDGQLHAPSAGRAMMVQPDNVEVLLHRNEGGASCQFSIDAFSKLPVVLNSVWADLLSVNHPTRHAALFTTAVRAKYEMIYGNKSMASTKNAFITL